MSNLVIADIAEGTGIVLKAINKVIGFYCLGLCAVFMVTGGKLNNPYIIIYAVIELLDVLAKIFRSI